jgi:hypothetical protein
MLSFKTKEKKGEMKPMGWSGGLFCAKDTT